MTTTFNKGDKVRYKEGVRGLEKWGGIEGTVIGTIPSRLDGTLTKVTATKGPQAKFFLGVEVGSELKLITRNLELIEPEFPRQITFEEIQAGDTIRRTAVMTGATEVREGEVTRKSPVYALGERDAGREYILAYQSDGHPDKATKVTLELLARPEPEKPKHWADAKPVGARGLEKTGERYVQKLEDGEWRVIYVDFGVHGVPEVNNKGANIVRAYNEDDFFWVKDEEEVQAPF